mmetsp:Transcript_9346/g.15763  ORF Transcript_9346/g.15763 Transcript_9346/m.15763 type:complete len:150 (+) Transcript_9346:288-737(+)
MEPTYRKEAPSHKRVNESKDYGGDLDDIWSSETQVKSKKFNNYLQNFAKKDGVKVKPVILPKGGLSYNPSLNDQKKQLVQVAITEEDQVQKKMKELKTIRPSLFAEPEERDTRKEVEDKSDDEEGEEEMVDSSDSEEVRALAAKHISIN